MKKIFVKKSIKNLTVCAGIMAMLMGTVPAYAYTRLNEDQMIHQELIADMENAPKISAGAAIVIDGAVMCFMKKMQIAKCTLQV